MILVLLLKLHCKNIMVISTLAKVASVALYEGFVIIIMAA
jgi:hypothetical protein